MPRPEDFALGRLRVDLVRRRVTAGDREVHLTPIEYRLLVTLINRADRVVNQREILEEVWGRDSERRPISLRVYMAQLRRKLEVNPSQPRHLLTVYGVGYRLALD